MRARLALLVSGAVCILREVKLSNKPAQLIEASPKGTVPVLVLADGRVIEESLDIMRWALGENDPQGWLAGDPECMDELISANDGPFKQHLDGYKYPEHHGADALEHRAAGLEMLVRLNQRLAGQSNLCGETLSLADAAILPFVRQFAQVDRAWFDAQPIAELRNWMETHLSSSLFERIGVRLPPWSEGEAVTFFPKPPGSFQG